ncbi:MAG: hypothetical protein J6S06_01130 [Alphaproteobacteria bacterium]|nr:hypothetical protein [Alphaproteobacteria bacterium]
MSLRSQIITLDITIFIGGKLNKRLLAFLLLSSAILTHYAYGVVGGEDATRGCVSYKSREECNATDDMYDCLWAVLQGTTLSSETCNSCVFDGSIIQAHASNEGRFTTEIYDGVYEVVNNDNSVSQLYMEPDFCPIRVTCSKGQKIGIARDAGCNTQVTQCPYQITCESCGDNDYVVPKSYVFTSSDLLTAYVEVKPKLVSLNHSMGNFTQCYSCGANSLVNSARTNCNCANKHYVVYQNDGSFISESVGTADCVEKDYHIRFNLGYTTQNGYIIYRQPSHVYLDPTKDNANLENAATLDHIVDVTRPKYVFGGWYTDLNKVFSSQNIIQKHLSNNPVSNSITIENGYIIYLTAKWNPKTYTISYNDDTTQECTYEQECIITNTGGNSCQEETLYFAYWKDVGGTKINPGDDFHEFELESREFVPKELSLYAHCEQCPDYKHCTGGKMYDCDEGKWCHDGKMEECPENYFCVDGKKESCPAGYWCSNGDKNPCPVGKTSADATSESQCFYGGGTSGTKFCDSTGGCFNLPSGVKISEK